MSTPSSQAAAGWVKDALRDTTWVLLRDLLIDVVSDRWSGKSIEVISEYVEENAPYIAEHLRDERAQANYDGAVCSFEIDTDQSPYIRAVGGGGSDLLSKLKRINPFDFEKVCARLLTAVGGDAKVTSKTRDGGIDFVAVGLDILTPILNSPHHCRASVIGQAKRYNNKLVAEKALREFVGASIIQRNELRIRQSIFPLSPVLLAFWTTSNFEPNTKIFARKAGVWLMGGFTLSSYLSKMNLTSWIMEMSDDPIAAVQVIDPHQGEAGK